MQKKLNLGCGEFPKQGYLNVDYYSIKEPDVRHNLDSIPYPFDRNAFELAEADHVLEHLHDVFAVMKELHRVIAPEGILRLKVPHFSRGFTHADHKRGFDVTFPLYFDPSFPPGYQGVHFQLESMRMNWIAQPYLKKMVLPWFLYYLVIGADFILSFFANLSPFFCSRIWCFWVGGFEELEFVFKVKKS